MNYKAGDRVVIKPWKLMEEQYGLSFERLIKTDIVYFFPWMETELVGTDRVVEINEVRSNV